MAHPGSLDILEDDLRARYQLPIRASQGKAIEQLHAPQEGRIIDMATRLMKLLGRQRVPRVPRQLVDDCRKSLSLQDVLAGPTGLLLNFCRRWTRRPRGKTLNLTP